MRKELDVLVGNSGWNSKPELKAYLEAVEKIQDLCKKQHSDRTFFGDVPACFFREYNNMFAKHVSMVVQSLGICVYLVGSSLTLARMLLQWPKCAKYDDIPLASFLFDSDDITLQHQGSNPTESIKINTHECMVHLTALVAPK
jgi:hypothetical protein